MFTSRALRSIRLPLAVALTVGAFTVTGAVAASEQAATPAVTWTDGPSFPSSFEPRWDAAVGYHPPSGKIVLFGGNEITVGGGWLNDTWISTGGNWFWAGPSAPNGLTPRGGAAMAFHPPTGDLVMFGGGADTWPFAPETWLFNGSRWRKGPSAPAGLKGRTGARMAYDPNLGALVLHGGSGETGFTDTWLYDANGWRSGPRPARNMEPRAFFNMAYDARIGRIIINGGSGGREAHTFTGTRWAGGKFLPRQAGPLQRVDAEFHPGMNATVTFGGIGPALSNDELFVFGANGQWVAATQDKGQLWPESRLDADLVWVDHVGKMLLVGGAAHSNDGRDLINDTFWLDGPGA